MKMAAAYPHAPVSACTRPDLPCNGRVCYLLILSEKASMYTEDIRQAPDSEPVCWCAGVSKGEILRCINEGADTLEAVRRLTRACTMGQCLEKNPRGH